MSIFSLNEKQSLPNPPCEGGKETLPDPPCEGGGLNENENEDDNDNEDDNEDKDNYKKEGTRRKEGERRIMQVCISPKAHTFVCYLAFSCCLSLNYT